MMTETAYAAVAVGHGNVAHLITITRNADGDIQQDEVKCGAKQQRGWTRSIQWGNEVLTDFIEQIDWSSIFKLDKSEWEGLKKEYWTRQLALLEIAVPAFVAYANGNVCSKCMKSTEVTLRFWKKKVAA